MVRGRLLAGCIAACACLAATAQDGTYYRWTDAAGTVHFTATPPPGKRARAVKVEGEGGGQATPTAPAEPLPPASPSPELEQAQARYRHRSCAAARSDLKVLDHKAMVVSGDAPDAATKLDDEQRAQARIRAQQRISQFCEAGTKP